MVTYADPEDEGCEADICVIELGGTVGDIESMPFIEVFKKKKIFF